MVNLNPEAKIHIKEFEVMSMFPTMEPQAVREMLAQAPAMEMELPTLNNVEDRMIPVSDGEKIKIRIYTPEGTGPFPIFMYYHGGGWVLGDIEMVDPTCRMIANQTNSVVVSVDYRLAPEYKFPVPVNDSYAALKWVKENAGPINGSASKIIVGGDSAGGNIATVVSMVARDKGGPDISAQVLLYPVTGMECNTESYEKFQQGFALDKELMLWFIKHYIRNEADKIDAYAAPLIAEDLSNLPPALIITAENDVLRDEGQSYAKRLGEANVEVESIVEKGLIHGYFTSMPLFSKRITETISKINEFLTKVK